MIVIENGEIIDQDKAGDRPTIDHPPAMVS
jgi:hypothetical protein